MPTPYIKKVGKQTGRGTPATEADWERAKAIVRKEYGDVPEDRLYALVTKVFKNITQGHAKTEDTMSGDAPGIPDDTTLVVAGPRARVYRLPVNRMALPKRPRRNRLGEAMVDLRPVRPLPRPGGATVPYSAQHIARALQDAGIPLAVLSRREQRSGVSVVKVGGRVGFEWKDWAHAGDRVAGEQRVIAALHGMGYMTHEVTPGGGAYLVVARTPDGHGEPVHRPPPGVAAANRRLTHPT